MKTIQNSRYDILTMWTVLCVLILPFNFMPHSVEVILERPDDHCARPSYQFTGAGLDGVYQLEQFHFHWGSIDDQGSEHSRNEKHFPMEV